VIYWGADPVETHPRHMERYSINPTGLHIEHGKADRTLVVIDTEASKTSEQSDWFLKIDPDRDFEVLWTLRGLLQGQEPEPGYDVGAPLDELKRLVERMKSCRCGIIFFGLGVAQHPLGHRKVEALLRLVIDLNQHTRFYARRMRIVGDVSGADSVLCWQTGYPFSVNLARGYPRYNPGEYSAGEILENHEADALVLVGTSRVSSFSPAAHDFMKTIPVIVLERPGVELPGTALPAVPTIEFPTATYGIHRPGTAYRMDEIPIRLRPILDSNLPSDGEILRAIHAAIDSR